jgi:hypothetical protein
VEGVCSSCSRCLEMHSPRLWLWLVAAVVDVMVAASLIRVFVALLLQRCGAPEFYCPGVIGDSGRRQATPGFYTVPIDTPDERTGQIACGVSTFSPLSSVSLRVVR